MDLITRYIRREHGPAPSFRRYMAVAVLNAVLWTACLAGPSIMMVLLTRA